MLTTRSIAANDVRIPETRAGEAVLVERYGKPISAIIDAQDLELFIRLQEAFGSLVPFEVGVSETAVELHELSERGESVEEFDYAPYRTQK